MSNNPKTQEPSYPNLLCAISHELKTPISAIIAMTEILKENFAEIEKIKNFGAEKLSGKNDESAQEIFLESRDFINEISIAANDLNDLVHDLLDVEQAHSGNFSTNLSQKIDIRDIVKRSVRLNKDYAISRRVSIKAEIPDDVNFINLDAKRMKQILTNLISNSVKYSPEGSKIEIICRNIAPHPLLSAIKQNPEFLEISIIDQGFGMNESQVQLAFQKYQTIQNPNSGKVDSFGMGLPIVKQLVELQNGKIEVESKLNEGTKMILKFPYSYGPAN